MSESRTDDCGEPHEAPLSSLQEWIHHQSLHTVGPPQVMRVEVVIPSHRTDADVASAVIAVGRVHEALRTRIVERTGGLRQIVDPVDGRWSGAVRAALGTVAAGVPPFGPLDPAVGAVHPALYRDSDSERRLVLDVHHLVCDDWGATVLRQALHDAVEGHPLCPVDRQPRHYAVRDRERERAALDATHERLLGAPLAVTFAPRRVRTGVGWGDKPCEVRTAGAGTTLLALARQHRVSTFAAWLAVMSAVVQSYTTISDQVVKTFTHNRGTDDEQVVATLVGELWLRIRGRETDTVEQRVSAAMSALMRALQRGSCAGHLLRAELNDGATQLGLPVRRPAFLCNWRPPVNLGAGSASPAPGARRLHEERLPTSSRVPDHDLLCTTSVEADQLHLHLILGQGLWPSRHPYAVCDDLLATLDFLAANPSAKVTEVPVAPLGSPALDRDGLTGVRVSADLIAEVLRAAPDVTGVRVDTTTPDRLTAWVEVSRPLTTQAVLDFHADAVARAESYRGVVVPDLVVLAPRTPAIHLARQGSGEYAVVTVLDDRHTAPHHPRPAITENQP